MLVKRVCGDRRVALCWYFQDTGLLITDPALDESMDHRAYIDSLFDPSHVKVKEGESPTWFHIRAMPRALHLACDAAGGKERIDWWIRSCVRSVENYQSEKDNGETAAISLPMTKWGDKHDIISTEGMENMRLDDAESMALFGMLRHIVEAGRGPLVRHCDMPSGHTES